MYLTLLGLVALLTSDQHSWGFEYVLQKSLISASPFHADLWQPYPPPHTPFLVLYMGLGKRDRVKGGGILSLLEIESSKVEDQLLGFSQ